MFGASFIVACSPSITAHAGAGLSLGGPTVDVRQAVRKPLVRTLQRAAELVPFEETDVFAKQSGYVSALYVDYGSHVRKGQVLAELDIPELRATIVQDKEEIRFRNDRVTLARAHLESIEAIHAARHFEYQRLSAVAAGNPGLVARQDLDAAAGRDEAAEAEVETARAACEAAGSALEVARAALRRDEALFSYAHVTAPFDGIVIRRYVNTGMLVPKGTASDIQATPLVRLAETDTLRLVIPVPESDTPYVTAADAVTVSTSASQSIVGRVSRLSSEVARDTRTMHVEVDVANLSGSLIPGSYAEAAMRLVIKGSVLTVPVSALSPKAGGTAVYVVNPNGIVEVRPVVLGLRSGKDVEVRYGIMEGEFVIVSERRGLRAGEKVYIEPALDP